MVAIQTKACEYWHILQFQAQSCFSYLKKTVLPQNGIQPLARFRECSFPLFLSQMFCYSRWIKMTIFQSSKHSRSGIYLPFFPISKLLSHKTDANSKLKCENVIFRCTPPEYFINFKSDENCIERNRSIQKYLRYFQTGSCHSQNGCQIIIFTCTMGTLLHHGEK